MHLFKLDITAVDMINCMWAAGTSIGLQNLEINSELSRLWVVLLYGRKYPQKMVTYLLCWVGICQCGPLKLWYD